MSSREKENNLAELIQKKKQKEKDLAELLQRVQIIEHGIQQTINNYSQISGGKTKPEISYSASFHGSTSATAAVAAAATQQSTSRGLKLNTDSNSRNGSPSLNLYTTIGQNEKKSQKSPVYENFDFYVGAKGGWSNSGQRAQPQVPLGKTFHHSHPQIPQYRIGGIPQIMRQQNNPYAHTPLPDTDPIPIYENVQSNSGQRAQPQVSVSAVAYQHKVPTIGLPDILPSPEHRRSISSNTPPITTTSNSFRFRNLSLPTNVQLSSNLYGQPTLVNQIITQPPPPTYEKSINSRNQALMNPTAQPPPPTYEKSIISRNQIPILEDINGSDYVCMTAGSLNRTQSSNAINNGNSSNGSSPKIRSPFHQQQQPQQQQRSHKHQQPHQPQQAHQQQQPQQQQKPQQKLQQQRSESQALSDKLPVQHQIMYVPAALAPKPTTSPTPSTESGKKMPKNLLPYNVTPPRPSGPTEAERKIEELTRQLEEEIEKKEEKGEYFGICYTCNEKVTGASQACQAMGNLYHNNCFICCSCGRTLRGKSFYNVQGKVYCEEDYNYSGFQQSAEKCAVCGHLIMEMILQAMGKSYHPGCFRCCICNECMDGVPFTVDLDQKIYCISDFHKMFAPKCCKCGLDITPLEGTEETVRVVSMDKDFHVDCYTCEECGTQLTDEPDKRCYPYMLPTNRSPSHSNNSDPTNRDFILMCKTCHLQKLAQQSSSQSTDEQLVCATYQYMG